MTFQWLSSHIKHLYSEIMCYWLVTCNLWLLPGLWPVTVYTATRSDSLWLAVTHDNLRCDFPSGTWRLHGEEEEDALLADRESPVEPQPVDEHPEGGGWTQGGRGQPARPTSKGQSPPPDTHTEVSHPNMRHIQRSVPPTWHTYRGQSPRSDTHTDVSDPDLTHMHRSVTLVWHTYIGQSPGLTHIQRSVTQVWHTYRGKSF